MSFKSKSICRYCGDPIPYRGMGSPRKTCDKPECQSKNEDFLRSLRAEHSRLSKLANETLDDKILSIDSDVLSELRTAKRLKAELSKVSSKIKECGEES